MACPLDPWETPSCLCSQHHSSTLQGAPYMGPALGVQEMEGKDLLNHTQCMEGLTLSENQIRVSIAPCLSALEL